MKIKYLIHLVLFFIISSCNLPEKQLEHPTVIIDQPKEEDKIDQEELAKQKEFSTSLNEVKKLLKNREYDQALHALETCINLYPERDDLYNYKGYIIINSGPINNEENNIEAIKAFSKAIQLYPLPKYYNNRGWSYQMLEKYPESIADFDKAVEINPSDVILNHNVLRLKYITKKYKVAMDLCDEHILKFPDDGYAYHVRGKLKRNYLKKYIEGNKDIKISKEKDWFKGPRIML